MLVETDDIDLSVLRAAIEEMQRIIVEDNHPLTVDISTNVME